MKKLSFVIPCYRSENTIISVIQEINLVLQHKSEYEYEIIAINDSSPDNVWYVLENLAKEYSNIKAIDLAKNMGKHSAMMAGYSFAIGDIIVSLDDDGQCPVDKLWDLLAPLEQGYDIAIARYPKKKQSAFKNFGSKVNDLMACFLIDKPKDLKLSNFYAIKRFVCQEVLRYHNPYPYVSGLFLRSTSKIKNVDMEERERIAGTSGYTFIKSLKLWLNGFTAFSVKPLRIATLVVFFTSLLGFLFAFYIVLRKIYFPDVAAGYSSLMAVQLFIGGIIMMCLGLIGEYVGRIYISLNNSPQYVIRKVVGLQDERDEE